ncbi:MAG: PKD domain-containing protein, partial [Bacteroidota bacterium]
MQKTTLQLVAIFILLGWGTTLYGQEQDCPRIDCGTIFANAEFGTNLVFCEGDTVTLTNTSEPGYDLFIVDWADGTVDTLDNYGTFVHAYENVFEDTCTNRRTFNIQFQGLSYCDEGFTCATLFYPVRIDPPVLADFEVAASACVGQDIGIVNTSCNADSYEWDFGDGNTSTDVNPGHAYSEPGVYTICLTAFGVVCEPDIECKTVLVVDPPSSSFTADGLGGAGGNVVCEDEIVTFSSTSELATTTIWSITPGQNDTTLWCYTDSTMTRFSDSISILFKEVGTYTIELIGSNACGDTIQELIVEVQDTPAIALEPPIPGCDSLRVVLADLNFGVSGPFNNVSWVFENADIEGSNQQDFGSILFNESGRIIAIVEGDCGTARDTVEAIVEIPQPLSLAGNPTQYCRGSSPDTLRANLPGGIWSGNGIINGSIGLFDPGEAGVGVHELSYVFVGVACVDSATITVEVTPSASIMLSPLDLCEDAPPTLLTASPPGGTWSHPHISPAGIFDPTSSGPGLFRPRYEFIDSNNCRVQRRTNVQVARLPEIMATDSALTCFLDAPLDLLDFGQVSVDSVGGDFQCQLNGVDLVDCSFNPDELGLLPFNFYQAELTYTYEECTVQRDFLLEVTENPPLTLDPLDTICINLDTFRLAANLEGGIWSGPGIDSISGLIDLSVAGGGTHQFTYSFEPDGTCEQIASQEVSIDDPNVIINVGPDEAVCEGVASTHILSLASPDGGRWSGPGIIDPSLGRIDLDSLIPGEVYTYNYTFTSASSDNCLATRPKTLTYHPRPDPNVVVDGLLCLNETLTFTTNNNTNNFSCQWDFGDGSTSTDCSPSHVYTEPGTYTITYRVEESHTNSLAITCSADTSFTISVVSPPQPAFILDSLEGCAPFSLGITDNSIGEGASQVWCIGEDTIVGSLPTDYILDNFIDDTWVTVSLKMNNFCGTRITEDSILVKPYPQVNFGFEFDDGCSPFTPDIRNVTIGNPVTWFWDMGQGTIGTDSLPPVVTYTTPDDSVSTYDITLISANACGRDTLVQTISVFPPNVEAFIGLDTVSGCGPWQFSPQSFSTPGAAIAWEVYNPSGLLVGTSSSAEPVFDLFDIGMHTIILLADGCGVDQDTAFFEVLPSPPVSFNHPPQVCLGEPLSFTNTSPSLSGGVWDFGDGTTSEQLNPTHMFDSVGTYTISFTGFSQLNNCPATVVSEVEVVGLPQTAFIPLDTADCSPFFVSFQNNSQALGPAVYTWDFGDGSNTTNETNPSHFYLDPGDYTVTLEVTDGNGCQHDTSFNFIRVHPDPVSAFELANPPVCTGDSLRIFNNSLGATSFFWRWGDEDFTGAEFPLLPAG